MLLLVSETHDFGGTDAALWHKNAALWKNAEKCVKNVALWHKPSSDSDTIGSCGKPGKQ